ncbi:hypothetical protein OHA91_27865 [Streptomyces erythrochromogenes]|uniref:Uncharacterized protein n=1 Tax=Streptomyces erythrochromogenes TaxID=285574 RepID=A0ABZ1QH46_9ACTN|nr:hypothetical protein [Streptomyces erythrochromogenes]
MQRSSTDGVTVLWQTAPAPGPLTAVLSFGTGVRDETAPTLGVTRLVEALAMTRVGNRPHEFGSTVGEEMTHFIATGTPDDITGFLLAVCSALGDLPLLDTGHTTRLLGIHAPLTCDHRGSAPLDARYGPHGLGLLAHQRPDTYARLGPDAARTHAATHFTRGNAVLTLDGPPPAGLSLPLPAGTRPDRPAPRLRADTAGTWQHRQVDTVSLLLTSRAHEPVADAACHVLGHRVEHSTHRTRGITDEPTLHRFLRDRLTLDRVLALHPADGHAEEAAEILWQETLNLARRGPTRDELDTFTAHTRAQLDCSHSHWTALHRAFTAEHFGIPHHDSGTLLAQHTAVTAQDVTDYLRRALTDAVLVVPLDASPRLTTLHGTPLPSSTCWRFHGQHTPTPGTRFRMNPLRRATTPRHERAEYVLTSWGLVARDAQDEHPIRFDEIALMRHDGPGRIVLAGCGCTQHVYPDHVARGERLIAALDAAVPAHLVRTDA